MLDYALHLQNLGWPWWYFRNQIQSERKALLIYIVLLFYSHEDTEEQNLPATLWETLPYTHYKYVLVGDGLML